MWIVRLALRRPYTFVVVSLLIAILGVAAIITMPVDIFPYIDIPVVSVVWNYNGLSPEEMEKRMVTFFERSMTTTVNDIEHIESQSYTGVSVTRVYFQPNAKVELALAQITAISQTLLRPMPPGTTAAQHHQVRRLQRADHPTRPAERDHERTGTVRHGAELHPHPAGHHSGRRRAAALRRQVPPGDGGSQPRPAHRQGTLRLRRLLRPRQPESDLPRRHRQNRRQGLPDPDELQPARSWRS